MFENIDKMKREPAGTLPEFERRKFLKLGFVVTGVLAGGGLLSLVSTVEKSFASSGLFLEQYPYKPHYSMVIRQNLCIDCELCVAACNETNQVPSYGYRTIILERTVPHAVGRQTEFIPMLCMQCNDPPCVRACPTRASYKDRKNGIVMMENKKCIGCKACMVACPYNARYFSEEIHAIDKCDFCFVTRLSKGEKLTACSVACPTGARTFGDLADPAGKIYRMIHQLEAQVWTIRPKAGTKPNVFYMKG